MYGFTIYWLGSSVTDGFKSKNESMADYIAKRNNLTSVKEALSGTTLATNGNLKQYSYVTRLNGHKKLDPNVKIDLFVCQISTNDAQDDNWDNLGTMPDNYEPRTLDSYNLGSSLDSVQYIIQYVKETWDCPILFYSGSYISDQPDSVRYKENPKSENYKELVDDVIEIAANWDLKDGYNVKVLDLFNNKEFNNLVTDSDYDYIMSDPVHPHRAGYLMWWTPAFEEIIESMFNF